MKVQRGDVVFLRFPFSDGSGSKVRPAVVVQSEPKGDRSIFNRRNEFEWSLLR